MKNEADAINRALLKMGTDIEATTSQQLRDYPDPLEVTDRISYEIRATNTAVNAITEALGQTMLVLRDLLEDLGKTRGNL